MTGALISSASRTLSSVSKDLNSIFCQKSSTFWRRKYTPRQPAPSCPATLGHGLESIFVFSVPHIFCLLFCCCLLFLNPLSVLSHASVIPIRAIWNPGMKAIVLTNHLLQFCLLRRPFPRRTTMENSSFLAQLRMQDLPFLAL